MANVGPEHVRIKISGCDDMTKVYMSLYSKDYEFLLKLRDLVNEAAEESQPCMPTMHIDFVREEDDDE